MRKRIQSNMLIMIVLTLIISYAFTLGVVYKQTYDVMEEDARHEINYIKTALNDCDHDYLASLEKEEIDTRITWINSDGIVLYDSWEDTNKFENHLQRKEMQEAIKDGIGQDRRYSATVNTDMFYYAVLLEDATVLRVSKPIKEVHKTALMILAYIIPMGIMLVVLASFMSKILSKKIVDPINKLDLDNPLNNNVYDEIKPLLLNMENNRIEKEQNEVMRKEFSANVSHELKTPLTSISGYAELIANGLVEGENIQIFAQRIHKESLRLIELINDIIKISKLDEGTIAIEKEELDIYEICTDIVTSLTHVANKNDISLTLKGSSVKLLGIKTIISEMIYNICENAIKYNKPNGSVNVLVSSENGCPFVKIQDTGIGIPKEDVGRIFERFYRVEKSHSKHTGGTGLGLSIVKHGARLHNATVEVESVVGKGTSITIFFGK